MFTHTHTQTHEEQELIGLNVDIAHSFSCTAEKSILSPHECRCLVWVGICLSTLCICFCLVLLPSTLCSALCTHFIMVNNRLQHVRKTVCAVLVHSFCCDLKPVIYNRFAWNCFSTACSCTDILSDLLEVPADGRIHAQSLRWLMWDCAEKYIKKIVYTE